MSDIEWVTVEVVLAAHEEQRLIHGGPPGVRDRGALESALARPINQAAYGDPDPAALAAAYAFGIARNHPFVDGNKRAAWLTARLFLAINGHRLTFDAGEAIAMILALAAGELAEDELADWFRQRIIG